MTTGVRLFSVALTLILAAQVLTETPALAAASPGCDGVVFGRVDFSGSLGIGRAGIESDEVTSCGERAAAICRDAGLDFVVGGAVSIDALENLRRFNAVYLSRFETRKVVFEAGALNRPGLEQALKDAVHFELLWLLNKRDYYGFIYREDDVRIAMLEDRWKVLGES